MVADLLNGFMVCDQALVFNERRLSWLGVSFLCLIIRARAGGGGGMDVREH